MEMEIDIDIDINIDIDIEHYRTMYTYNCRGDNHRNLGSQIRQIRQMQTHRKPATVLLHRAFCAVREKLEPTGPC